MRILKRWRNSEPLRYLLTLIGFRHNNDNKEYEFVPYFQYKIGPYESDHTLYFDVKPSKLNYHREIFTKMVEYKGYSLIGYLDYHYNAYTNKKEFLRFIRYETLEKLIPGPVGTYRTTLELILEWEKEEGNKLEKEYTDLSKGSRDLGAPSLEAAMNSLIGPFSGKIELNNQLNTEKFTQLFILTLGQRSSGRDGEYLFKNFSDTDLAVILHHFEHLGHLRLNTLQKKVAEARKNLRLDDPRV